MVPFIIFGTQPLQGSEGLYLCQYSYECGIRTFDTALAYQNHSLIGEFTGKIQDRPSCRILSKITNDTILKYGVEGGLDKILDDLQIDYLDVLFVHAPKDVDHRHVFTEMSILKEKGKIRKGGASNYTVRHLKELADEGLKPDVVQNEIHPLLPERDLVAYAQKHKIEIMAHSVFANGQLFQDAELIGLGKQYDLDIAQIALMWNLMRGIGPIFSSTRAEHIKKNVESCKGSLPVELVAALLSMKRNIRVCDGPWAEFN